MLQIKNYLVSKKKTFNQFIQFREMFLQGSLQLYSHETQGEGYLHVKNKTKQSETNRKSSADRANSVLT